MKRAVVCAALLLTVLPLRADEGMWLPGQIADIYSRMRAKGLKLKSGELYSEQNPALCDAVVAVDGGMGSGSIISHNGLMITNHHVAYGDICALSTPEHNYLETGFWARTRDEEIPVEGKTVQFLREVRDVTDEVLRRRDETVSAGRWSVMAMRRIFAEVEKLYGEQTECEVECKSMWSGRRYLLFYYDVYRDVRLVGAPPVTIGAFGGDTDNWGWPQHKGDFALYRVYTAPDGKPAAYSPENVPLVPRKVLEVSTSGVGNGDFTMVIGFPGRTNRYSSSYGVEERQQIKNPIVVANRQERMEILRRNMERDPMVRMDYSDSFFNLSNYADYAKWESRCLRRFDVAGLRSSEESRMARWIASDTAVAASYGTVLDDLRRGYAARRDAERNLNYFRETWLGPSDALLTATRVVSCLRRADKLNVDTIEAGSQLAKDFDAAGFRLREGYDAATDRELIISMVSHFLAEVPRDMWGEDLAEMYDAAGGDSRRMVAEAFDSSFCSDCDRYVAYFAETRAVGDVRRDPLVRMAESVRVQRFTGDVAAAEKECGVDVSRTETLYAKALYEFRDSQGVPQYPDANSTLRISYGTVGPLDPSDGVHYDSRSTIEGYVEKYDPEDYAFRVDDRLRALIADGDWGRWGERGKMYVNFITDNDITGGNSGSPVLDSHGRLVGLAFDGNRESMAGDVWFNPSLSKTVCVDIRYVMWVIEHYAGAAWLLDEIGFVK